MLLSTYLKKIGLDSCADQARNMEKALKAIRDFEPDEVTYDKFTYNQMVDNYRDAARKGLNAKRRS